MMKKAKKFSPKTGRSHKTSGRGATTSDILSVRPPPGQPPIDPAKVPARWSKHYRKLMRLREALVNQIGDLAQGVNESVPNYGTHLADSGTDAFDRDFALSLLSSDHNALWEIDQALQRIEDGTFGVCELTGKPIGTRRLEAIPWTRFSAEAKKQLERDGETQYPHLGNLGSVQSTTTGPSETGAEEEKGENE